MLSGLPPHGGQAFAWSWAAVVDRVKALRMEPENMMKLPFVYQQDNRY
jgi:hypothetical protein